MEQDDLFLYQLLPRISTYLRYAMGNIHFAAASLAPAAQREADPVLDQKAALLDQSYYRLLRLVSSLSGAALLAETDPLPTQDLDVVYLVSRVCEQCQSLAALLGLDLSLQCDANLHICAVNRDAIEQLLFHLLSNAFKFTPKGGTVRLELKFASGRAFLSVSDTGQGIPEDQLEYLFDRYLQDAFLPLPPQGLGLGLPICQRIAQRHGGNILAESRVGKGTKVTVSLPDRRTGVMQVEEPPFDYAGGFNRTLLGLADALPVEAFRLKEQE